MLFETAVGGVRRDMMWSGNILNMRSDGILC